MPIYSRSSSRVAEGSYLHMVRQLLPEAVLEHCIVCACPQRHFARCERLK